jgi:hypothetical protein
MDANEDVEIAVTARAAKERTRETLSEKDVAVLLALLALKIGGVDPVPTLVIQQAAGHANITKDPRDPIYFVPLVDRKLVRYVAGPGRQIHVTLTPSGYATAGMLLARGGAR